MQQPRGWAFRVGAAILRPILFLTTKPDWQHTERIPATGGCLIVLNHVSYADPLTTAHFVHDNGRLPRYLAKSSLFKNKVLGFFLRSAGQIPVERLSRSAVGAYDAAVTAVNKGECVVIYPEGTITRDPALWPMVGKTGAARIALATGCPVIPVGQWGAQKLLAPYAKKPDLRGRKRITLLVGDPVELADLVPAPGATVTGAAVAEATTRIMDAITELVAEVRGELPPLERFDPRRRGVRETGNPNQPPERPDQPNQPGQPGQPNQPGRISQSQTQDDEESR